jgi:hypothetical protein
MTGPRDAEEERERMEAQSNRARALQALPHEDRVRRALYGLPLERG